ncbi:hypothetical protein HPB50_020693 [Hyalomma asiaticum]|uniref:Uncharacterized protein n=1 Tax=Hyalomma asiaticum TaxID=266040 RepID=A0ACB7S2D3_HYAAI|nr:hypothetical protein HPB50_020693 [Hyalomma asiaticum]
MLHFKHPSRRTVKAIVIAYPAFVCVFIYYEVKLIRAYLNRVQPIGRLLDTPGCTMPLYPSFHRTIRRANETDTSLHWRCPGRRATVIYRRGRVLYMNESRLASYYGASTAESTICTLREVMRNESLGVSHDWGYSLGPARRMVFGRNLSEEFVAVTCVAGVETLFTDYFLLPQRKKRAPSAKRGLREERPINVLVLGIDSTSRMNFDRHMKRTRKLVTEELLAFEFFGYNKVGESSFGNQIPLLSGLAADDVDRLFRDLPFDSLPHLWSVYKKRGFTTLSLEEMPSFGLFVYPDYKGFRKPPTDYYPVPVVYAMGVQKGLDDYCAGSRLKTQVFLDYLGDVMELNAADGNPLFSYVWLSDVPHSNDHALLVLDDPVYGLLRGMQQRRAFDDTVVVLLSDHGARFGTSRASEIGRHEDKTPFGFMMLPERLMRRHPTAAVNLEVNQRRLVTAYDFHATLLALSRYDGVDFKPTLSTRRGISLFGHVPPQRTCGDAFVSAQFCECQGSRVDLDENSELVESFASFVVHLLNARNEVNFPGKCIK